MDKTIKSRRPDSYKEQKSCSGCIHCFKYLEHDCPTSYYCTYGAPKRPPCGSIYMGEGFGDGCDFDAWDKNYQEWMDWKEGRAVKPQGVCDNWA